MTDERRVEVAAEALMREPGMAFEAYPGVTVWPGDAWHLASVVVAALDALDGDLRERLAGAVYAACPHHHGIGACACCQRSARIIRERP